MHKEKRQKRGLFSHERNRFWSTFNYDLVVNTTVMCKVFLFCSKNFALFLPGIPLNPLCLNAFPFVQWTLNRESRLSYSRTARIAQPPIGQRANTRKSQALSASQTFVQFRQITKNDPSFSNNDLLRRMLYLRSQRIVKRWRTRCTNWDLVLSQLAIMFPNRVAGDPAA